MVHSRDCGREDMWLSILESRSLSLALPCSVWWSLHSEAGPGVPRVVFTWTRSCPCSCLCAWESTPSRQALWQRLGLCFAFNLTPDLHSLEFFPLNRSWTQATPWGASCSGKSSPGFGVGSKEEAQTGKSGHSLSCVLRSPLSAELQRTFPMQETPRNQKQWVWMPLS